MESLRILYLIFLFFFFGWVFESLVVPGDAFGPPICRRKVLWRFLLGDFMLLLILRIYGDGALSAGKLAMTSLRLYLSMR